MSHVRNRALSLLALVLSGLALAATESASAGTQCCVPGHWYTQAEADAICVSSSCASNPSCGVYGGTPSVWSQAQCVDVPLTCAFTLSGNQNIPVFRCQKTTDECSPPELRCTGLAIPMPPAGEFTVQDIRNCVAGSTICSWQVDPETKEGGWASNGVMPNEPNWWKYPGGWAGAPWTE